MKIDLFETTKRLYELELYDDLLLFVELNLQEHKIADQLLEDEQAFVYMCIAGAYFFVLTMPKVQDIMTKCSKYWQSFVVKMQKTNLKRCSIAVANEVPEALLCKSYLITSGNLKIEDDPIVPSISQSQGHGLVQSKRVSSQVYGRSTDFNQLSSNNLRIVLELAHFYNIIGDRQKALNCFQGHTLLIQ
uniref:Uncharacterized protein n=1 Tax=Ditylenchus dipsaci TaxID=166011 RepID=A0A915CV19_9BILA